MNDKSDMAWPSYARITNETGLSRPTIAKHFELMDGLGWLSRERGNSNKNTRYYACIPQSVSDEIIANAIDQGSKATLLRSKATLPRVVKPVNSNIQVNIQDNKQYPLFEKIIDMYIDIIKATCNAKGLFKDAFLNSKERMKPLMARVSENVEHEREEFWFHYLTECSKISWVRDGIDGEAVCTFDMLINKTKFNKNVEAFWA
jgi:hypothetical protein